MSLSLVAGESAFEVPREKFTIYRVPATASLSDSTPTTRIAQAATARPEVVRVAPVYALGSYRAVVTDRLIVGIRNSRAEAALTRLGLAIIERFPGGLLVRAVPDQDPEALVTQVASIADVTFVEPDFAVIGRSPQAGVGIGPSSAGPPPLGIGYAATLTGLVAARQAVTGTRAVTIAVLDDGLDLTHPDLRGAVRGTYDATTDRVDILSDMWNEHGTACAGLAAGAGQVSGFGGGCSLLAVRIARSAAPHTPWVTTTSSLRRGIDWAAARAAVLSLSWGGTVVSSAVADSIARARSSGRGGLGCIVVAAAGNTPGPVDFPASLPEVLAVSGSNARDEFKTPTSSDGETWWGSASGEQVDIAAPSVGIRTTGLRGSAGDTVDDYLPAFNGTSAATPMVAGAAALVLSVIPNATEAQVRALLTGATEKIGGLAYVGGRNDLFGAGRLNVERAVRAAGARPPAGPPVTDGQANEVHLPPSSHGGGSSGTAQGTRAVPPHEVHLPLTAVPTQQAHGDVVPPHEVHLPLRPGTAGGSAAEPPPERQDRLGHRPRTLAAPHRRRALPGRIRSDGSGAVPGTHSETAHPAPSTSDY